MSEELKTIRTAVNAECKSMLDAYAHARGVDINVIARDALHEWSQNRIRELILMRRFLGNEGIARAEKGIGDRNNPTLKDIMEILK